MTADEFRVLALALPDAVEQSHHGHPDFRVRGRIFATLGPEDAWAMVKLTPDQQAQVVGSNPTVFEPFQGAWGRGGATKVHLEAATEALVKPALQDAWSHRID